MIVKLSGAGELSGAPDTWAGISRLVCSSGHAVPENDTQGHISITKASRTGTIGLRGRTWLAQFVAQLPPWPPYEGAIGIVQRESDDFSLHTAKAPDNLPQWLPYLALRGTLDRYLRTVIREAVQFPAKADPISVAGELHEVYDVADGHWTLQDGSATERP